MKNKFKIFLILLAGISCTSCASLFSNKVVKAPCGPTAGMTDPCGNRTPVNSKDDIYKVRHTTFFENSSEEV